MKERDHGEETINKLVLIVFIRFNWSNTVNSKRISIQICHCGSPTMPIQTIEVKRH
jgi:hypothetical protein